MIPFGIQQQELTMIKPHIDIYFDQNQDVIPVLTYFETDVIGAWK